MAKINNCRFHQFSNWSLLSLIFWNQSESESKHYELTSFCFCQNKNKKKNNRNIQDMSKLVALNLVKLFNSQKKHQAFMEFSASIFV